MASRITKLPGQCKSLSDTVRVIDVVGTVYAPMTLAEAQALAKQQSAELVHLATHRGLSMFRCVDETLKRKLRKRK